MEVGWKVKVSNPQQINYPLAGEVIEIDEAMGIKMSKVKFVVAEVWYDNKDLTRIKTKER